MIKKQTYKFTVNVDRDKYQLAGKFRTRTWVAIVEDAFDREIRDVVIRDANKNKPPKDLREAIARGLMVAGSIINVRDAVLEEVEKYLLACTEKA